MYNRIISYLEKFCIPHNNQFGFRSKHSTTHALLLLTDKIQRSGLSIKAGSLRRSACCQTTLRRLVLPRYQLKRSILCLKSLKTCPRLQEIASKQMLFSKNCRGTMPLDPHFWVRRAPKNARCACQGSMPSPLLFPLYLNDLLDAPISWNFIFLLMIQICFFNNNPNILNLENILNVELEKVNQWFYANKLSLNIEKNSFGAFHSQQRIAHKLNLVVSLILYVC